MINWFHCANASIEALLKKEADFARMIMEESLPDRKNESRSRGGDSDSDVVIGDDSRQLVLSSKCCVHLFPLLC